MVKKQTEQEAQMEMVKAYIVKYTYGPEVRLDKLVTMEASVPSNSPEQKLLRDTIDKIKAFAKQRRIDNARLLAKLY